MTIEVLGLLHAEYQTLDRAARERIRAAREAGGELGPVAATDLTTAGVFTFAPAVRRVATDRAYRMVLDEAFLAGNLPPLRRLRNPCSPGWPMRASTSLTCTD